MQVVETFCGLTQVHTRFSRIIYSCFSQKEAFFKMWGFLVTKWSVLLKGSPVQKSALKTISNRSGDGFKNFLLTAQQQNNVHTEYVKQRCVHVGEFVSAFKPGTQNNRGQ